MKFKKGDKVAWTNGIGEQQQGTFMSYEGQATNFDGRAGPIASVSPDHSPYLQQVWAEDLALVEKAKEAVDHPVHYGAGVYEVINIIEHYGLGFHMGNVIKYCLRAGKKNPDPLEDLKKAQWYLLRHIANRTIKVGDTVVCTDTGDEGEVLELKDETVRVLRKADQRSLYYSLGSLTKP